MPLLTLNQASATGYPCISAIWGYLRRAYEKFNAAHRTTKDSVPLLKSQVLYSLIKGTRATHQGTRASLQGTRASLQGTRASPNTCTQHVVRKP